jgi:hypothetical protein
MISLILRLNKDKIISIIPLISKNLLHFLHGLEKGIQVEPSQNVPRKSQIFFLYSSLKEYTFAERKMCSHYLSRAFKNLLRRNLHPPEQVILLITISNYLLFLHAFHSLNEIIPSNLVHSSYLCLIKIQEL